MKGKFIRKREFYYKHKGLLGKEYSIIQIGLFDERTLFGKNKPLL